MREDSVDLQGELETERACAEFEEQKRLGLNPKIRTFVPENGEPWRASLLRQLLLLDLEYGQSLGQELSVEDYVEQLPGDEALVREVLRDASEPCRERTTVDGGVEFTRSDQIGPYKIREKIGEGGFGVVYVADQEEPLRRRVAIKIIKPGMDSREVIARFEAERQALAIMDHPNIAKVLDAGTTDRGLPYFVMELVRGISITDYCDSRRIGISERLTLFVATCHAIQHAHQKGVIHRDIKPSNVLITEHDGVPMPKVIDFGVAKAINQNLTDQTIYTRHQQMVGTPLYMSPEQAELSALDVDTRSDIYSLGVVLYELLTGALPLSRKRFIEATYDEIRRIILVEDPPKPSTRISTLGNELSSITECRRTDASCLRALLRGDLDWIVMTCLEKDRTRRYDTAAELAADVQRHLVSEPIVARPPSATYRIYKAMRRNRLAYATGFAVLSTVLIALFVSLLFWRQAVQDRDALEFAIQETDKAYRAEQSAKKNALAVALKNKKLAYAGNLARAANALEKHDAAEMKRHLESCPEELRGWEWRYLWALRDQSLQKLGDKQTRRVNYSANGEWIVSVSFFDGAMTTWNAHSLQEQYAKNLTEFGEVQDMSISPDGERVAVVGRARDQPLCGLIQIVETRTGVLLKSRIVDELERLFPTESDGIKDIPETVFSVRWISNQSIAFGGMFVLYEWNIDSTKLRGLFKIPDELSRSDPAVMSLDLDRERELLAVGYSKRVGIFKLQSALKYLKVDAFNVDQFMRSRSSGGGWVAGNIALGPDGTRVVCGANPLFPNNILYLWDAESVSERPLFELRGHTGTTTAMRFSPSGRRIASASLDRTVRLWDVESGQQTMILRGHEAGLRHVAFSPDGDQLVSGGDDGVRLWRLPAVDELNEKHSDRVSSIEFTPDGKSLMSASWDGSVRFWDSQSGRLRRSFEISDGRILDAAISPDGSRFATSTSAGDRLIVALWDHQTGQLVAELPNHNELVEFTDKGVLATASTDGGASLAFIRTWASTTGEELQAYPSKPPGDVPGAFTCFRMLSNRLMYSERYLGSGLYMLDLTAGDPKVSKTFPTLIVQQVACHTATQRLAIGEQDGDIHIADATTFKLDPHPLLGHTDLVTSLVFNEDGTRLFSGGFDGTIRIWSTDVDRPSEEILAIRGLEDAVNAIALSPDGETLAVAAGASITFFRSPQEAKE